MTDDGETSATNEKAVLRNMVFSGHTQSHLNARGYWLFKRSGYPGQADQWLKPNKTKHLFPRGCRNVRVAHSLIILKVLTLSTS